MSDEKERTATEVVSRFTLIEWLVAAAIVVVVVWFALPSYSKLKDKAKEAEVKQNLHSIQEALVRYAEDHIEKRPPNAPYRFAWETFTYPPYLYGGDGYFNLGTSVMLAGKRAVPFGGGVVSPFDKFFPDEYKKHGSIGSEAARFGDPLIQAGYLTHYPKNPFVGRNFRKWFGSEGILLRDPNLQGFIGCGGVDGDSMFNVGLLGEFPAINIYKKKGDPNDTYLDFPGQFYYHPRYADGGTVAEHNAAKAKSRRIPPPTPPGAAVESGYELSSERVEGCDLMAFGSPTDEGMDIDWSVRWTGVGGGENHAFREGYLVNGQERNAFNSVGGFRERSTADGYGDFCIIILNWSID